MVTRRNVLRTFLTGMAAMMAAFPLAGATAPGAAPATLSVVQGPDPATYVYVEWGPDGRVLVMPPGTPSPWIDRGVNVRGMGIPRVEFPEFHDTHGPVVIFDPSGKLVPPDEWTVAMIRAHYVYAIAHRTPKVPLDENHLSVRFMPNALAAVVPLLDWAEAKHVTESYSGPDGWLVETVSDERGPMLFGDKLRHRILTGNVELRLDGEAVHPGTYTAPLLR